MKENPVRDKSYAFALDVIEVYNELRYVKKEYELSRQLVRSGTSIGAMIRESEHAESKKDFIHKLSVALKEAVETDYWIKLLKDSNLISPPLAVGLEVKTTELIKLLTAIIKTSKQNN